MHLTFSDIVRATGAHPLSGGPRNVCRRISTDSRTVEPGDWFVALIGERFDAHEHLEQALKRGAGGFVVSRNVPALDSLDRSPVALVEDTLVALGQIAALWRAQLSVLVIDVTGSSGKTTTKDILGRIMARRGSTLTTRGNFNNRIGVPLELQRLTRRHRCAVLEIAMNLKGEIDTLAAMTRPRIGVITNIGDAHVGMFNGDRSRILEAKAEMIPHIAKGGTLVLNADDTASTPTLARRARQRGLKVVRFSAECNRKADVWVEEAVPMTPIGHRVTLAAGRERVQVPLRIFGHYNVANLAAAAAAARCAGASLRDVAPALQGFQPTKLRSSVRTHRGVRVIADCYNANPQSMEEALASLGNLPASGKRVAVLGEMRELGKRSATFHRQVGAAVKRVGVDQLITFGEEARLIASGARTVPSRHFDDAKKCAEHLRRVLRPGDVALIKGSRLLAMERILEAWEARQ